MGRDDFAARAAYQPEPTAVAAARRFVRDTLREWIITGAAADGHGVVDDAVLLTSELVTNAVVHAGTPVRVDCRLADGEVEVVVSDGDPASLVPESRQDGYDPAERTSGRGLLLPAALASAWGVSYGRAAKAVWFRLGLPGRSDQAGEELPAVTGAQADELRGRAADGASLALALRDAPQAADAADGAGADGVGVGGTGAAVAAPGAVAPSQADPGYEGLLMAAVESAQASVSAEAACAMMADEDGELRLRAAVGGLPGYLDDSPAGRWPGRDLAQADVNGAPPSVVTAAFVVDGRVTGLLSAACGSPGRFGDDDWVRVQRVADRWGAALERARLSEVERRRRGRLGALADARALLADRLDPADALALAGRAAVPRLASWCAALLPEEGVLRPAFVRHAVSERARALGLLLERVCAVAGAELAGQPAQPALTAAAPREPVRRWPLAAAAEEPVPAGAETLAGDDACCFPLAVAGGRGYFVIGCRRPERLPREVTELAADLACRLGVALRSAGTLAVQGR